MKHASKVVSQSPESLLDEVVGILSIASAEQTEADTRANVIDRVLATLGWTHADIAREEASGAGDYLDYELRAGREPWMVLEAKRSGRTFDLKSFGRPTTDGRLRSIGTLVSRGGQALRDVMKQAAGYCNDRGVPFACVTNGQDWVFFRGLSRSTRPWNQGTALVFRGTESIRARFTDFVHCLGRNHAGRSFLPETLERDGDDELPPSRTPRDVLIPRGRSTPPESVAMVRAICDKLLSDIHTSPDKEMLERCYVQPGISGDFHTTVRRLLKDSEERVIDEAPKPKTPQSTEPEHFASEVARHDETSQIRDPIVVVGHVGAGKTTFLHRAISHLRNDVSAICALVDLTGFGHGGSIDAAAEEARVATTILEQLGRAARSTVKAAVPRISEGDLKHTDPYSPETLRTLLRDEIARERELGRRIWDKDQEAWDRKEYEMLCLLRDDPCRLLTKFIKQLRSRFRRADKKKFSVLVVLDNLDQATDDYQRCVYGFAERIARHTPAIVVTCIREDTFHIGRRSDGFLSSSALTAVYHVPSPPLDHVLRQRVAYARHVVDERRLPKGERGHSDAINSVCEFLDQTLTPQGSEGTEILAALAGHNMREGLALVTSVVEGAQSSPAAPNASGSFVLDCLVRSRADSGALGRTRLVDLFDAPPSSPPCHGLRARLLAYFSWTMEQDGKTLLEETERVIGRFSAWGYPAWLVRDALGHLVEGGALRGRRTDPNELPVRLSISASGFVHITRLMALKPYRTAMALTTRWYDADLLDRFIETAEAAGGLNGPSVADIALSSAADYFEAYLSKMLVKEDRRLLSQVHAQPWIPEVLTRARIVDAPRRPVSDLPPSSHSTSITEAPRAPRLPSQLVLADVEGHPNSIEVSPVLPLLSREARHGSTVWIPRILWALEWARLGGAGRLTAAQIARVLTDHADLDVPGENVARAFRELKKKPESHDWWRCSGRRYEITESGTLFLRAFLG